jgi:dCMP deaminase
MNTAREWSTRSTCSRLHVGAVLARDTRIIATGYNGAVAGMPHCDHTCRCPAVMVTSGDHAAVCGLITPCTLSVHAEANALAFAARYGVATLGAHLYVTHAPCAPCARLLVNAGVAGVWYGERYRSHEGLDLLTAAGIPATRLTDSTTDDKERE